MTAISPLLSRPEPRPVEVAPAPTSSPRRSAPAPRLRSFDGGRSPAVSRRRRAYRRRRVVVAVLLVVSVVVLGRLAGAAFTALAPPEVASAGGPAVRSGSATDAVAAPLATGAGSGPYIVQPGDTLWSIARRVRPDGDPRAVVDQLSARLSGGVLHPGQPLDLADLDG